MNSGRSAPHPTDADTQLSGNAIAACCLSGAGVALILIQCYAWLYDKPGLGLILGSFS